MNQDQRDKLASALIEEAFTWSEKGDIEEARSLMKQATRVRFHDVIKQIIAGDTITLSKFVKMQYDKDQDRRITARSLIHVLIENKEFLEKFQPVFHEIPDEEEN